ncbi:hypothetical protein CXF68_13350 [Tenacibaculum sp. Bg11-29]|uniref:carboxypeptidase-like regulatory domain-containing protein n=1 Tax=Tenacibaculum sp. Bg11-29 TaxID=2058306 RepID=UPI000C32A982|nr:carboxypeptidase-like regulatory domain-containing protein [Tenacibaculum sp. Bg11-29]PKH51607.1 hypothetical protein CXF68_13350 [Tenacibaculum sp. Bg11-29]
MKNKILFFAFWIIAPLLFSQKTITGTVLDKLTLEPIEFVDIYNKDSFTITNEEGKFDFVSKSDSIKFHFLGYENIKLRITDFPSNSIIYLDPKSFNLEEVIVNNKDSFFKKMVSTIKKGFSPKSYNEEFFLRTILKRNDSIIKIQDLNGIVNRKVLFSTTENPISKKNYTVYINNMRKAAYDKNDVYFKLLSFNELLTNFVRISVSPKYFKIKKSFLKEDSLIKLDFNSKSNNDSTKGYYILNSNDYSLSKVMWSNNNKSKFTVKRHIKYRDLKNSLFITFIKKEITNKYRIDNAKLKYSVECFYKGRENPINYDITYIYKTATENHKKINKKNKISNRKDIFKIKHPFNKNYWNNNEQLKLTSEMVEFLKTLETTNSKTITNFQK